MFDLKGKTALITGASGAIGGAIAGVFHGAGANVVLSGTRIQVLEALANELDKDGGGRAHGVPADLSKADFAARLVADAEAALGGSIDILVNNAGLTRDNLALRIKDQDWQTVLDVNLTAAFKLSRACLRGMMKKRWGRLIGIASVVGVTGNAGQANYAASKAGLIGLTKSLAQEVATRGITGNCIAPGFIESPMTDDLTRDQMDRLLAAIPSGRFGTAADVGAAALYLASDEASYVTGQTLHVNGGMTMI